MIRKLRRISLILIAFSAVLTCYLAIIKPKEITRSIMIDSFNFSSKEHDTLLINYQIPDEEFKDLLLTAHCYSNEYGGEEFLIQGIEIGKTVLNRKFEIKDSTLIFGIQKIKVGDTFEDVQQYKSLRNIFRIEKNKLSIKNEGFIKIIKILGSPDQQSIIPLKKPILLITGNSYDSYYINKSILDFYRTLPYILIFLGVVFWLLGLITKMQIKINHNH